MNEHDDFDDAKPLNPFALAETAASPSGAVAALQKREEAEIFAMVMMAKRFPREPAVSMDRILNAFARPSLAEVAQYQFARGGTDIVGPSIRAAEAIAQEWGNLDTGWSEVERGIGADGKPYSLVEAYCMDLQSTMRKRLKFIVPHWRDTRSGGYKLKDERDIYEVCANMAQRRLRACILASIPGDVIETAMKQAEVTLRTSADTSPEAQKKLLEAFAAWGVTKEHIEARIQRRLDTITPAQMVQMKRIYVSLRDDMSKPRDWFEMPEDAPKPEGGATSLDDIKAKANAPAATPTPSPTPAPAEGEKPQGDLLGAGAPPPAGLPSFDELKGKLQRAKSLDALDVHADWIRHFSDEPQRLALNEVYEARKKALEGGHPVARPSQRLEDGLK
jgi:hypothetical protein